MRPAPGPRRAAPAGARGVGREALRPRACPRGVSAALRARGGATVATRPWPRVRGGEPVAISPGDFSQAKSDLAKH